ncbi:hypothetical protein KAH85_05920 [Candidatus Bathyarchaeota archaeon]|nr:hypothetical protein [Candidatus Bathyarchaeota archaeon]
MSNEGEFCFGQRRKTKDYIGVLSFGIFVIVVGVILITNPNLFSEIGTWVEQMTDKGTVVRPPDGLIFSGAVFFGLMGVSNFIKVALRLAVDSSRRTALSEMHSGVALVCFAYFLHLYSNYAISWQLTLALEIVAIGLLVISYSALRLMLRY